MSALGGFWSWRRHSPEDACRAVLEAQAAYGPVDRRLWRDGPIALGRGLYNLLPEDAFDRQPLAGGGGRYILVADLRLDNRDELAARLGHGQAESNCLSDAQLLLDAYERWGDAVLDRIVGDYAFVLWDAQKRQLLLARDPTGQRPLYYHRGSDFFAFASLAKGLHALPSISRRPDAEMLAEFIGLLPNTTSKSFYAGVERVPPGHVVTVSETGIETRRYWHPRPLDHGFKRSEDWRDAFRSELDRAVRVRMRGGGNRIAAHLSGGWDSSAVAATAARLSGPEMQVLAFTAVPAPDVPAATADHRFADESAIAAATAVLYPNMRHILVHGVSRSPIAGLDELVSTYDRPLATLCNHVWMAEIRSRMRDAGARVLLTGELGNWNISAAPHSILSHLIRQRRMLTWAREAAALGGKGGARWRGVTMNSFRPWIPRWTIEKLRPFSKSAAISEHSALHPRWHGHVAGRRRQLDRQSAKAGSYAQEVVESLLRYDFGNFRKGALAGWGIDERDPTSDRRLTELCLSMPLDLLLKDGERRPLARAALSDRLPDAVLGEKRKGYQAADWHVGMTRDLPAISALVEEMAGNDLASSLIDVEFLRTWIRQWPAGGWERPQVIARYRSALLMALSAGHFILSTSS